MTTKKERREALERMTKAELVKTVVTLDARQVKLLNEVARLTSANDDLRKRNAEAVSTMREISASLPNPFEATPAEIRRQAANQSVGKFPWEQH